MKKIRCLGDSIDGNVEVCYFIHRGDWGDRELEKHQEGHNEETWEGYEEIKVA
jgi:hypothetical protein